MTFRPWSSLVVCAISTCVLASACSGKNATAQAFVAVQLESGATMGNCNFSSQNALQIGATSTNAEVTRVPNGGNYQGPVQVNCTVHKTGTGYHLQIGADNNSSQLGVGGGLTITGDTDEHGNSSNGMTVVINSNGTYNQSTCSLTAGAFLPAASQGTPPAPPPIAPGRIWGNIVCDNAQSGMNYCVANVDFVFENCTE